MTKSIATMAGIDPRVAIFTVAAMCIVALGGMALGYDVELNILGNGVSLSSPREDANRRLSSTISS